MEWIGFINKIAIWADIWQLKVMAKVVLFPSTDALRLRL